VPAPSLLQPLHGSSAELHRTRKPLLLPEEIGHPDPGVPIILLEREINLLFAAHIVDQPKPALAAIPDFIVGHFPIKDERASPSNPGSHHPAGQGVLVLRRITVGGETVFADEHPLSGKSVFRLQLRLQIIKGLRQLLLGIGEQRIICRVGNKIDAGRRKDDVGSARPTRDRIPNQIDLEIVVNLDIGARVSRLASSTARCRVATHAVTSLSNSGDGSFLRLAVV
jgi:hypothetical protein